MSMLWLYFFGGSFLLLLGMLIGNGLYTEHRKRMNDEHARGVRERRRLL